MNEPVAYINAEKRTLEWATPIKWETPTTVKMDNIPLYTKKEWVGLTEDEAQYLFRLCLGRTYDNFWQAIEAKLKEKNGG
jgi:hypothetical protein